MALMDRNNPTKISKNEYKGHRPLAAGLPDLRSGFRIKKIYILAKSHKKQDGFSPFSLLYFDPNTKPSKKKMFKKKNRTSD